MQSKIQMRRLAYESADKGARRLVRSHVERAGGWFLAGLLMWSPGTARPSVWRDLDWSHGHTFRPPMGPGISPGI